VVGPTTGVHGRAGQGHHLTPTEHPAERHHHPS
jgi:hypothetical protein